jgi:glycosyltransferase involved in cell wall biosynthesis
VGHRLHDRKRADLLLAVFAREVLPAMPSAELWLVCDERVTQPQVKNYSNLSDEELTLLYRSAWVFCMPSSYEGFGRPYAEALACKTAVVATPNAGSNEILENGRYGLIVHETQLGSTLVALFRTRRARLAARADVYMGARACEL